MMKWIDAEARANQVKREAESWAHQVECQADAWRSWGAQAIAQARADDEWREWMEVA